MGLFYILEFGGQHTDLIGNRLTELGHEVRYAPSNTPLRKMKDSDGIILSGGPKSVYEKDSFISDPEIFKSPEPVLGICYGLQLMVKNFGGKVFPGNKEYGITEITVAKSHPLFDGVPRKSIVWMNHGDSVSGVDESNVLAYSDKNIVAVGFGNKVAVQFHPELTHTEYGKLILKNFAEKICSCRPRPIKTKNFNEKKYIAEARREIRKTVGKKTGLVFLSGGVDSSVAFGLALGSGIKLIAVHLDMGNERKGEASRVKKYLEKISGHEVHVFNNSEKLIKAISGLTDPEDKRRTFQRVYDQTLLEVLENFDLDKEDVVFIDGTLATDRRESGKEAAKKESPDMGTVAKIKTHHNVRGDDSFRKDIRTVEPLRFLSKDGARRLGRYLGLPNHIIDRPPFPGPGLVVRLITGVHPCSDELESQVADISENHSLKGFVLPIKTVGLKGDNRTWEHLALVSGDRNWNSITLAQKQLAENLPINRTVFWHSSWGRKGFDPAELWYVKRGLEFDRKNVSLLQEVTEIAEKTFAEYDVRYDQLPVIAFPSTSGHVCVAIRDINSIDFRSVRPLKKPEEMPWELCDEIASRIINSSEVERYGEVDAVVFDASTKPAATTEWE